MERQASSSLAARRMQCTTQQTRRGKASQCCSISSSRSGAHCCLFLSQLLHTLHVLSFDPVMIVDPS